jgi:hypothetical protein
MSKPDRRYMQHQIDLMTMDKKSDVFSNRKTILLMKKVQNNPEKQLKSDSDLPNLKDKKETKMKQKKSCKWNTGQKYSSKQLSQMRFQY